MVNMMLWTALSFSALCAHGFVVPRAPDVSLASLIRNSKEVQGHMKSIKRAMTDAVPYSEGPLQDFKSARLDDVPEAERKCLYLRNSLKPDDFKAAIDINPHADYPDVVTGDRPRTFEVTTSIAKINTDRLGWNKETSAEVGGSATGGVSSPFLSLSATVYGNYRSTGGQNGESSKQTEFRSDFKTTDTCPSNSICRVVTWTYFRTITGRCFITPYLDTKCYGGIGGKYSLGLFPYCQPLEKVTSQFLDINRDKVKELAPLEFGPDLPDIKMHRPEVSKGNKHEENCTFSYVLRMENGDPVRAQAVIIEPLDSEPEAKKSPIKEVPKARKWVIGDDGDRSCKLEKGWSWQAPHYFYIPKSAGGSDKWETRPDLAEPEGFKEKCPEDAHLTARAEAEAPPKNDLIKVAIIGGNVLEFVLQLGGALNAGFVANRIIGQLTAKEPAPIAKPNNPSNPLEGSAKPCLAEADLM